MADLVTIVIATRNRPAELRRTLAELARQGLARVPLLVLDDGSDPPLSSSELDGFSSAQLIRRSDRGGYIVRRNELAAMVSTPFALSLDDDVLVARANLP